MPLNTTYRPTDFNGLVGNESTVESLNSVLNRESDVPHSFLFTGPAGTGKSTCALILKNILGCSSSDFHLYNAASSRGIDTIREIIENSHFMPMGGDKKLIILEECHQLTVPAQESLLVILEEPPKHVYFALCTTLPEKLKPTLKRRCHHYELKELSIPQTKKFLKGILEEEGVKDFSKDAIDKIANVCNGSAGKALNLLDTIIDIADPDLALKTIEDATVSEANIVEIARLLLSGRSEWKAISTKIKGLTGEAESLRYAFLGYFQAVLLSKGTSDVAEVMTIFCDSVMYSGKPGLTTEIFFAYKALLK